jgi:hypothetical protein
MSETHIKDTVYADPEGNLALGHEQSVARPNHAISGD